MSELLPNAALETYKRLQLNAGVLLWGLRIEDFNDADALRERLEACIRDGENFLGATRGEINFHAKPIYKRCWIDGSAFPAKSGVIEGWELRLETTLVEFTSESIKKLLPASSINQVENNNNLVEMHNFFGDEYIENIIWVGDMANGGLVAIELKNVVNTMGINANMTANAEGMLRVAFEPHAGSYFNETSPPFGVYFLS